MSRSLWTCCAVSLVCLLVQAGSAQAQCSSIGDPALTPVDALPWRGSAFTFGQSLGAGTFSKSSTLSYDPLYLWLFDACAQWYFNPSLKASIEQEANVELTDSNSTTSRQRWLLSDTSVRVDSRLFMHRWGDVRWLGLNGGVEVLAPTSLASRAQSVVIATRIRFGPRLMVKDMLAGTLFAIEGSYLRRFARDTTVIADTPYPCLAGTEAASECTHLAGNTALRDAFIARVHMQSMLTAKLGFEILGTLTWSQAYALDNATFVTDSGMQASLADTSTTHWRNSRRLLFGIFYQVTPYFGVELSTLNDFSERRPDGELRGAFRASDTVIGLDARLEIDLLYAAARGAPTPKNAGRSR